MGIDSAVETPDWRRGLPTLVARVVALREIIASDLGPLVDLLSAADAPHFGGDESNAEVAAQQVIDRAARDRTSGLAFTYAITIGATHAFVGLVQVRQLDPAFEAAECECTIAPALRGTGIFLEAAQLVGSFAFGSVGVHRLESRVLLRNGRGNGAMRKLRAVQEGILRRSARRGGEYVDQVLWSMLKDDWGGHWVSIAPRVH